MISDDELTARIEPFDSFWEAPDDIERGYSRFARFYATNYLRHLPEERSARILIVSSGPGYMVNLLSERGYTNVVGIDSSPTKVKQAQSRGLNCQVARVFAFLEAHKEAFDAIFAEQEINHLTKEEIVHFLIACRRSLREGGQIFLHSINGANPFTGTESRAGNFDHYNSFTEYSLEQILEYAGFIDTRTFPLQLYVFYLNPLNYVGLLVEKLTHLFFWLNYRLVGKQASIYTKKIAASARKPPYAASE